MGRKKLEIKLIEDKCVRQVTFSKRRKGLMKKAKELSILCDLDVGLVVFSSRGKCYQYSSNNSLTEILERYQSQVETVSNPSEVCEKQVRRSKYQHFISCKDLLQIVERELDEPSAEELSATDLINLQKQFESALIVTRATQTDLLLKSVASLHEKEKMLEDEKTELKQKIEESKGKKKKAMKIDLNVIPEESKSNAE